MSARSSKGRSNKGRTNKQSKQFFQALSVLYRGVKPALIALAQGGLRLEGRLHSSPWSQLSEAAFRGLGQLGGLGTKEIDSLLDPCMVLGGLGEGGEDTGHREEDPCMVVGGLGEGGEDTGHREASTVSTSGDQWALATLESAGSVSESHESKSSASGFLATGPVYTVYCIHCIQYTFILTIFKKSLCL